MRANQIRAHRYGRCGFGSACQNSGALTLAATASAVLRPTFLVFVSREQLQMRDAGIEVIGEAIRVRFARLPVLSPWDAPRGCSVLNDA